MSKHGWHSGPVFTARRVCILSQDYAVRMSVCLPLFICRSVTRNSKNETAKQIIKICSPLFHTKLFRTKRMAILRRGPSEPRRQEYGVPSPNPANFSPKCCFWQATSSKQQDLSISRYQK